ncbi:hypothetical protein ACO0LO_18670 [Undibacterium sp. TJN25]|uniref:hypothetical protein n=1 Tax=Undibacterium sp. TJN25 TaxID=3413056 RepID=UPI003BF356F6
MANFALSPTSVRSLKNALQDRFPSVKSSHLSEAIAITVGFRTHAALLAYTQGTTAVPIVFLDDKPFVHRLNELGYLDIQPFSFSTVWLGQNGVPEEARNLIARLLKLEERPEERYPEIYALRRECAILFGKTFGIGYVEPSEDGKDLVKRWTRGIDHKACQPGWGTAVNTNHPRIEFAGNDHQVRFYERLPLSNGKYVEYSSALVSMPYKGSFRIPELPAAQALAARVGWRYAELADWTWYSAHATTLIFYRRTTTHEEMLQMWSTSFKRWLIENKSRLMKGTNADRRNVINDAIDCQHLPLDVQTWDELRERYFKEFAPSMYHFEDEPMARAFKKVFDKWLSEREAPEELLA